jgi:hypothetical protein
MFILSRLLKVHPSLGDQSGSKLLKTNVRYVDSRIKEHVEKKVMNASIVIKDARTLKRVLTQIAIWLMRQEELFLALVHHLLASACCIHLIQKRADEIHICFI